MVSAQDSYPEGNIGWLHCLQIRRGREPWGVETPQGRCCAHTSWRTGIAHSGDGPQLEARVITAVYGPPMVVGVGGGW